MSEVKCPNCESTDFVYWERGTITYGVLEAEDGQVLVGKAREEDVEESGYYCEHCDAAVSELDDLEKEFAI